MRTQILPLAKLVALSLLLVLVVLVPASRGLAQDAPPRPDQAKLPRRIKWWSVERSIKLKFRPVPASERQARLRGACA